MKKNAIHQVEPSPEGRASLLSILIGKHPPGRLGRDLPARSWAAPLGVSRGARRRLPKQSFVEKNARRSRDDGVSPRNAGAPRKSAFRRQPREAPRTLTPDFGKLEKFKPATRSPGDGNSLPLVKTKRWSTLFRYTSA